MKRIIAMALAAVMALAVFAGCGAKEVKLDDVMTAINSSCNLNLQKLESVDELNTYYNINTDDVKQFAAEIDSNNNAPVEVILIEAVNSDAASNIESALTARYNSIVSQYASYTPELLDAVKACEVKKDGNFVTMIVAENADEITKVYNEQVK